MAVVRYLVGDVDAALAFYTEHLGFEVQKRWGAPFAILQRAILRCGFPGQRVRLRGTCPTVAHQRPEDGIEWSWKSTTSTKP